MDICIFKLSLSLFNSERFYNINNSPFSYSVLRYFHVAINISYANVYCHMKHSTSVRWQEYKMTFWHRKYITLGKKNMQLIFYFLIGIYGRSFTIYRNIFIGNISINAVKVQLCWIAFILGYNSYLETVDIFLVHPCQYSPIPLRRSFKVLSMFMEGIASCHTT